MNEFILSECVEETGLLSNGKGRRSIGITLSDKKYYVIGIRLARTYFKVASFNLRGEMEDLRRIEISEDNPAEITFKEIIKVILSFIEQNQFRKLLLVGMAIPGPFFKDRGKIGVLTGGRRFEQIDFKEKLENQLNIKVIVEHDAKAGAFAQLWYDKEIDKKNSLIYVAAGEGIGAGIIIDQKIVYGELGTAGEIGHMTIDYRGELCECGNRGCLEKYCSLLSVRSRLKEAKGKKYSLKEIKEMIKGDDIEVINIYRESCRYLGYGIVNIVNTYNPTVIILGDELTHVDQEIMLNEVDKVLKERLLPEIYEKLTVKISGAVKDSVLHGIGAMCTKKVFDNYSMFF